MSKYREALHKAMQDAMLDPRVVIIGQGVSDHKGIFGTTLGLAEKYPDRVIDTPLAEESTTGIAIGMALNGLYPIQTHIRADFALVAMNQIVNLAAKYHYMFGGRFSVPMLIRMVIGRSWGQGAQHSQSLQSLFAHIPGLTVVMPSSPQSILDTYHHALQHNGPVISFEHRLMYELEFNPEEPTIPFGCRRVRNGYHVTVVATSIMVLEALRAADYLSQYGISCDVIDLHCISHPDKGLVLESVADTRRLLIADTSWQAYGVSAEVCRWVCEAGIHLQARAITLGMAPSPCPTAKSLEDIFYPNLATLTGAIAKVVGIDVPLPDEKSMADVYKKFRGPF